MTEPKYMDLGDFIPQTYKLRFSIEGNKYEFDFAEATVDEVLTLITQRTEGDEDIVRKTRRVVVEFLLKHATESMDITKLRQDLNKVPYKSNRGSLDIVGLYAAIQQRHEPPKVDGDQSPPSKK